MLNLHDLQKFYLPKSESTRETIIDTSDAFVNAKVKQISSNEIKIGDFILIRTKSDKNYLTDVVDSLLGDNLNFYRNSLSNWKTNLKERIDLLGINNVISEIQLNGSNNSNEVNLNNWISEQTYGPKDQKDFEAIMIVLGKNDQEIITNWNIITQMRAASIQSGKIISRELTNKLQITSLNELEIIGYQKFKFSDIEDEQRVAVEMGIMSVPTILFLPVDDKPSIMPGAPNESQLEE